MTSRIGKFEIQRRLGEGAMGEVFLALDTVIGREVAIKTIRKDSLALGEAKDEARERFYREARAAGGMNHPNLVTVHEFGEDQGLLYLAMEYVPGEDLATLLSRRSLTARELLEVLAQICDGLAYAHAKGVLHRDIKPSNIRVTPDGDIKVLDFGIARADFSGREAKTEQVRYGSLGYMAPERVLGDDDGPSGDIYAVGCVLVELLRGKAMGRSGLLLEQQLAQVDGIVAEMEPKLGPEGQPVLKLLRDLLAYEPEARPTAGEVAERARKISRALGGEDLAEFSRRFLPMVTALLGDESKEASGQLTEQATRVDTATLAMHVEKPGLSVSKPDPTRIDPLTADTVDLPSPRRRWVGPVAAAAALLVLAIGAWALRPTPQTPGGTPIPTVAVQRPPPEVPTPETPSTVEAAPVEAAPAEVAPVSTARPPRTSGTRTTSTATAVTTTAPVETTPVASAGPTLRAVKFAAPDATKISAACGAVSGGGTTSALLRDVPAGSCSVSADIAGQTYRTRVDVSAPSGFTCALQEGALACR